MRALTLWRPWDTAILYLGKPVENREWGPPSNLIGQRIALHSGKKFDEEGACTIVKLCHAAQFPPPAFVEACLDRAEKLDSVILGTVRIARVLERRQQHFGAPDPLATSPWFFGSFGWVCEDVIAFPEPVPCKGAQGLWTLPPDVEARVRDQERLAA